MNVTRFPRLLALLLAALLAAAVPAAAKELLSVVPAELAGFVKIDFRHNGMMEKGLAMSDLLMDEEMRRLVNEMKEAFGFSPLEKEFLTNFLSTTLVVFPAAVDPADPKKPAEERVGVIVELKDVELFQKYLEKIREGAKGRRKDLKVSTYDKAKFPIEVYEKSDPAKPSDPPEVLYTAFFDNLFAIGVGPESGVAILEALQGVAAGGVTPIAKSESFARLTAACPLEASVYLYVAGDFIARETKRETPATPVDYVDAAGFTLNYDKGNIAADGVVLFKKDAKNPVADYLKVDPVALGSTAFLPGSSILFTAFRFAFPKEKLADRAVLEVLQDLNTTLGLDFEKDILPWLGNEYFVSASDYDLVLTPPVPTPRLFVGVKVTDRKAAENAMEKVEAAYKLRTGLEFTGTVEAAIPYRAIVVPSGGMLQDFSLAYFFQDDYLVFATGRLAVAEVAKVTGKQIPSLKAEALFGTLLGPFAEKSVLTGYVNGVRLMNLAIKFMETQNTPESEMKDIRSTRALKGLGFGLSHDGQAIRFKGSLMVDMEMIKKLALEPVDKD